jgi:hypothetical protein
MPRVGEQDVFEQTYLNKLKALLAPYGQFVSYEQDRAALDLGMHLYEQPANGTRSLGQVRVWFQVKGMHTATSPGAGKHVAVGGLRVADLRYWHAHPEPVYLVVYLSDHDQFLAADVRDLIDAEGGVPWLTALSQQTATLHVPLSATLEALVRMPRHRTLRLDGPDFRGRPLGHRYDPLRSELEPLSAADFETLVARLLEAHDFRAQCDVDLASMLDRDVGAVTANVGRLYLTYEWTTPLATEFGYDPGTDFRLESSPAAAHGDVLVVVHSRVAAAPRPTPVTRALTADLRAAGIERALVFYNDSDLASGPFGGWRVTLDPLVHTPQGLGSLTFNVLTTTSVYLEFLDRLRFRYVNYL